MCRSLVLALALLASAAPSPCFALEKIIRKPIVTDYAITNAQFFQSISHLLRAPLVPGNKITELVNGDAFFPVMLDEIRKAKKTICIESFIWDSGKISDQFIEALSERAQAGVKVHCVIDGIGVMELKRPDRARLRKAGVELEIYNPILWYKFWDWNGNHRTHRKLLIVDGRVGFTGGVCIADAWMGNAESVTSWRDTEYKIEGPLVGQMQSVFMDNWTRTRSEVLHGEDYFPKLAEAGNSVGQCFKSGHEDGAENARLLYLYSIAAARKSIRISHSYFVPDNLAIDMLVAACKRGVKVEVIAPGIIDFNIVRRAARSRWSRLMDAGVRFYEFQPARYHCKTMIVDDVWVTTGSVNFDDRSFRINGECNINVMDPEFAERQIRVFEDDKTKSIHISPEAFRKRSWFIKCVEKFCGLFRSQL